MAAKDTPPPPSPIRYLHGTRWDNIPGDVQHQTKRCLLDLIGVAAGSHGTDLSRIIRDHAAEDLPGPAPMLLDDRTASQAGAAMAAGMMIDSLDGHDGFNPAKGHIGAPLLPVLLGFAHAAEISGRAFLEAMAMGYEFGGRIAEEQHATCPDYHTSGSWGAVAGAAAACRVLGLNDTLTRHALGIAEYHGPRSQMMRVIDVPTMLKDGAGWGASCAVSAVQLAKRGFTGAPAITIEQAHERFADLGARWLLREQYFKPYPVCRWAQAPIEGVLALRRTHDLTSEDVDHIEIETFHESCRLATARPGTTEDAQYSTSFPVAVAMVKGRVAPEDIQGAALQDPEILRLSTGLQMHEHDFANTAFPGTRYARVTIHLTSGDTLLSDWMTPRWDADAPPTDADLEEKYFNLARPVLGDARSEAIRNLVWSLDARPFSELGKLLFTSP